MTRRWTLTVATDAGSTLVRGWQAGTVLMAGGWRPVWLGGRKSWALDARHEADVLAYLQSRGVGVTVTSKPSTTASIPDVPEVAPDDQGDLLELLDGGDAA